MTFLRLLLISVLCLGGLVACDDESDAPKEKKEKTVTVAKQTKLPEWLTTQDKMEPAVWLRSKEVGHEVLPSDPEVDRLRRALYQASSRFFEDDRMIANRTVQTGEMMAEAHEPERLVDIMTGMIDVADATPKKQLYGDMCQQYLNIRRAGTDRTTALAQLFSSYKTQNNLR